jgi:hypothetical protein
VGAERDARCIEEGSMVTGAAARKDKEGDVVIMVVVDDIVSESGVNRRFDWRLSGDVKQIVGCESCSGDSSSLVFWS